MKSETIQNQQQIPVLTPDERRAEALDAGTGFAANRIRHLVGQQLAIDEFDPMAAQDATPDSASTHAALPAAPKWAATQRRHGRRGRRPQPKFEATDRDMEIAESLNGTTIEPGYVPDVTGPGFEEFRKAKERLGARAALHGALLDRDRPARNYPAVMAAHEDKHKKSVEKPYLA